MTTPTVIRELYLAKHIIKRIQESADRGWWWDKTNNPFRGCTNVSEGCRNCWALADIEGRLRHQIAGAYTDLAGPTFVPAALDALWRDLVPKRYFVPSMSDPLHDAFDDATFFSYFDALVVANWHYYFVLTKRADRLAQIGPYLDWPDHVIAVVSVESQKYVGRIERLIESGAKRKGLSVEPLIGHVDVKSSGVRDLVRELDYVIVGGETAPQSKVRPMRPEWAREWRDVCGEEGVPFMFKQHGDVDEHGVYVGRSKAGRLLDGRTHDDLPRGCLDHLVRAQAIAAAEKLRRRIARA